MTQKTIRSFVDEIYSEPPKKNYITNKTEVYHIDDIWPLDILDLKDMLEDKDIFQLRLMFLVTLVGQYL